MSNNFLKSLVVRNMNFPRQIQHSDILDDTAHSRLRARAKWQKTSGNNLPKNKESSSHWGRRTGIAFTCITLLGSAALLAFKKDDLLFPSSPNNEKTLLTSLNLRPDNIENKLKNFTTKIDFYGDPCNVEFIDVKRANEFGKTRCDFIMTRSDGKQFRGTSFILDQSGKNGHIESIDSGGLNELNPEDASTVFTKSLEKFLK